MKQQKEEAGSVPDAFIYIVGKNSLQNELLLSYLSERNRLQGECLPKLKLDTLADKCEPESHTLFLIDCKSCDMESIWQKAGPLKQSYPTQCAVALCNADPRTDIEKKALATGLDGIFFETDPPRAIAKGVSAILSGDLWYSRKSMTRFLLEPKASADSPEKAEANALLTTREKEILALIASGYNSPEVAEKLFISSHTVKTHIYNIYSKIKVKNRLQAVLWAAKYL